MGMWNKTLARLKSISSNGELANIAVSALADKKTQYNIFKGAFDSLKDKRKVLGPDSSIIVTSSLEYTFEGDDEQVEAEWIGVPMMDIIIYIGCSNGRQAITGDPAGVQAFLGPSAPAPADRETNHEVAPHARAHAHHTKPDDDDSQRSTTHTITLILADECARL